MKNVDLIARTLESAGVKWVFGVPSGPVLPLIDALERTSVRYVLTASETSAGFMASAVGSLTGTPGVCLSTLGPGATNMATGVGCAWLDCAPLIAITCNVPTPWLERRIQMRIDHHALFAPITKATLPLRHNDVAERLAAAIAIATAEPPGPVHLDLPEDVGTAEVPAEVTVAAEVTAESPPSADSTAAVAAVADALAKSRRPVVMTGLGFTRSRATRELLSFLERQGIPFISTMHGKGWLPESHPNWTGVLGRARRTNVQRFINGADLVIAVGYDPIEINYEEWLGSIPVVHVANQSADVDGSVNALFNEAVDMDEALRGMAALPPVANDWSVEEWAVHRAQLDADLRPETASMSAHRVLDALREKLPADGILVYDVGAHTHQIATQWRTDLPNTCVSTNGWSSMGYGIPGAIAAKLGAPGARCNRSPRRRLFPDDRRRDGRHTTVGVAAAHRRAQRRLAGAHQAEAAGQELRRGRLIPRRAAGAACRVLRRALPRRPQRGRAEGRAQLVHVVGRPLRYRGIHRPGFLRPHCV